MNWLKQILSTISEFNGPPTLEEAQKLYQEGDKMVRYHAVYFLAKHGDYETVRFAAENDPSELVRNMSKKILSKL